MSLASRSAPEIASSAHRPGPGATDQPAVPKLRPTLASVFPVILLRSRFDLADGYRLLQGFGPWSPPLDRRRLHRSFADSAVTDFTYSCSCHSASLHPSVTSRSRYFLVLSLLADAVSLSLLGLSVNLCLQFS